MTLMFEYRKLLFIVGHYYPTPKQIRNILKPDTSGLAARWFDLGTQLLNDTFVLDVIKADHSNDASACCNEVFVRWLKLPPKAPWNQLTTALSNIGMNSAAEQINKHCKGLLGRYK